MKIEIVHCSFPYVGKKNGPALKGRLMVHIVESMGHPLNAHSCRCLAHFYAVLEKVRKSAHTVIVGKRIGSESK
jgi:hypothetical protein